MDKARITTEVEFANGRDGLESLLLKMVPFVQNYSGQDLTLLPNWSPRLLWLWRWSNIKHCVHSIDG